MIPWTLGPHVNLTVRTFGIGEIKGVETWIDNYQPTFCTPMGMRLDVGSHAIKVRYGFLEPGPEEELYIKYTFMCWEDLSTNNTRTILLEEEKTIIAFYKWKIINLW